MISIIMPCETTRINLLVKTLEAYAESKADLNDVEFVIPSRTIKSEQEIFDYYKWYIDALNNNGVLAYGHFPTNIRVIPYEHDTGFNPAKALNTGVRYSRKPFVIITSPEVMPKTDVLAQLRPLCGQNVVCQVFDTDEAGNITMSLVNSKFRTGHPGMYFLALFNKSDIEWINGWDEEFMNGYAFEDDDFGHRWVRAGIPFIVRDDIQAIHQWHARFETIKDGWLINQGRMQYNDRTGTTWVAKGLKQ